MADGGKGSTSRAGQVGRSAVRQGVETLALARIHGEALRALVPDALSRKESEKAVRDANSFFFGVLAPVERNRVGTRRDLAALKLSNASLLERTSELTASNRNLKREISQRMEAERMLKRSKRTHLELLANARKMQFRLRHLSHQVLLAQEEERKEISRELHDEIVQTLTGINVQLATLKIESGVSKESFSKHISRTQRLVEKSVNIVHQFARDLRPALLDDLGLIPALLAYMKGFTERTGLRVKFLAFAGIEKLSNEKRTVLFRVAQAALVNVQEHARASNVSLHIKELQNVVTMEIKDDGRSFNVSKALDSKRNKRLGLIGMRERVEMVGGTFSVESAPELGTKITATIPIKRTR